MSPFIFLLKILHSGCHTLFHSGPYCPRKSAVSCFTVATLKDSQSQSKSQASVRYKIIHLCNCFFPCGIVYSKVFHSFDYSRKTWNLCFHIKICEIFIVHNFKNCLKNSELMKSKAAQTEVTSFHPPAHLTFCMFCKEHIRYLLLLDP